MTHDHRILLLIAGMRDNRAREEVVAILAALPGVMQVDVNLIRSNALVRHDGRGGTSELSLALERAGYASHESNNTRAGGKTMCSNCTSCKHAKRAARTAQDVMTAEPICVEPSTSIRELVQVFQRHKISGVPVVDRAGKLIGVASKMDLIRRCSEGEGDRPPAYLLEAIFDDVNSIEALPEQLICVGDFMAHEPLTVNREAPLRTIAQLMSDRRVHRVIVVDDERVPVGIVTTLDLLKQFPD